MTPIMEPVFQSVQSLIGKQKAQEVKTFSGKEVVDINGPLFEEVAEPPEQVEENDKRKDYLSFSLC